MPLLRNILPSFTGGSVQPQDEQELNTKLFLRIHAANLPRVGILQSPPDTFAVVTSVSGRASKSGPENPATFAEANSNVMKSVEWGRTEVVYKNAHPQWVETFPLNYIYGTECYFYIQIFRLSNDEPVSLGNAICEVGDILGSKNHTKVKRLPKGGVVFCRLEPVKESNRNTIFRFQFAVSELDASGGGGKRSSIVSKTMSMMGGPPDTILQISKRHPNASRQAWIIVYRSSPVMESEEPTWDVGELDLESCCNGDLDRPLRLAIMLHKKSSQDVPLAECETTLRAILNTQRDYNSDDEEAQNSKEGFRMKRPSASKSKPSEKVIGFLQVPLAQLIDTEKDAEIMPSTIEFSESNGAENDDISAISGGGAVTMAGAARGYRTSSSSARADADADAAAQGDSPAMNDPYAVDMATIPAVPTSAATFHDYVKDGLLLDFCVAIDFTSSNGDPRIPGTLHDQSSSTILNDYEETIVAIGNAVAVYSDQFAVWGFGAKFGGTTRHLFQCGPYPKVHGVEGILGAYKSVFESDLIMSGPTLFDQVLQSAAVRAQKHKQSGRMPLRYCILLIITDGISQEIEETKRKLAVYSSVPLSVIFVGIGRAEFKSMYNLCDGEQEEEQQRKNTTFVEFRHHQHDPASMGRAALSEMPNQIVEYMTQNGIQPSHLA